MVFVSARRQGRSQEGSTCERTGPSASCGARECVRAVTLVDRVTIAMQTGRSHQRQRSRPDQIRYPPSRMSPRGYAPVTARAHLTASETLARIARDPRHPLLHLPGRASMRNQTLLMVIAVVSTLSSALLAAGDGKKGPDWD